MQDGEEPRADRSRNRSDDERKELTALLKLVGSLGFGACGGIFLFFLGGAYLDKQLHTGGALVIVGVVTGVGASLFWTYRRIMAHFDRFVRHPGSDSKADDNAHG